MTSKYIPSLWTYLFKMAALNQDFSISFPWKNQRDIITMIFKIRSFLALALALSSLDVTVSALSVPVDYRDSVKKVPIDYSVKNGTFYYISGYNSNKWVFFSLICAAMLNLAQIHSLIR